MPSAKGGSKGTTNQSQHKKKYVGDDSKAVPDCVQINKKIIAASQSQSVEHLLQVISQHVWQMNIVNLSTAAHRLAKLVTSEDGTCYAAVQRHHVVPQLFDAALREVERSPAGSIQPQAICNIAWSLARLRFHGNPALVDALAHVVAENIHTFKPFELATSMWAFAKLVSTTEADGTGGKLNWSPKHLFEVVAVHLSHSEENYGFRCLATIAWSFASVHYRKSSVFRIVAQQMKNAVGEANTQEVGNTFWAFATMGVHDLQLPRSLDTTTFVYIPLKC
eukprot:gnl/TRDRNA2_/TRDRNA2_154552_c1_seq2.p1 gnl/TRDRNA2_/TRDRNA2_154552_c1~~gnl/TRDRNA2_/TRDRNA2_154552_c1_seq2.p1  ORF type:complete len:278 (-),score=43.88 gnl/TRDRNA2_/TRDRNA2_154552_c1_seq2:187-1020(-)